MASNFGLVRFDGRQAKVFPLGNLFRSGGTGSCASNSFTSLLLGPDKNIWVGAGSGCILQLRRDRFGRSASFEVLGIESPPVNRPNMAVAGLYPSHSGSQIDILRGSGIGRIDLAALGSNRPKPPTSLQPQERALIPAPTGISFQRTSRGPQGHTWAIGSNRQLYSLQPGGGEWVPQRGWKADEVPNRLLADREGNVWIGTDQGLFHRRRDGSLRSWTKANGLKSTQVLSILEDHTGCIWIGSYQSVSRLCGERMESMAVGGDQEELISSLAEDPQGNIWLGGRWGNLYRISVPIFQVFTRREGALDSHFTGVTVDRGGGIWASTREAGVLRINGGRAEPYMPSAQLPHIQALVAHPERGILAASSHGIYSLDGRGASSIRTYGLLQFDGVPALFWHDPDSLLYSNGSTNYRLQRKRGAEGDIWIPEVLSGPTRIRQWTTDASGNTWAVAQYQGLLQLSGSTYQPAINAAPDRSRGWFSLTSDREGLLWIGTVDGVEIYSPKEQRFLTKQPLLAGDHVFHIGEDKFGSIWCATRNGLVRFSRNQSLAAVKRDDPYVYAERFGEAQGLPTTNFGLVTSSTGASAPDGRMWFPGLLGLVSIQPADFERTPRAPVASLLQMNSDGAAQDLHNGDIRIAAGTKTVEFLFQTLRIDALGGEHCRVQLKGFNPQWQTCNDQRAQQYTGLPPGTYEFRVQTSSRGGLWNGEPLAVPFTIEPALHQRLWIRVLGSILVLAGIGFLAFRRNKQLMDQTRWLQEKVNERTATLAQATAAAEAANRAKSEFLATMSHEIRTPMNGVLGAAQLLDESPLNLDQQQLLTVIRQSGEHLVGIVDDILSLAKVEAGQIELEYRPVAIQALGESLISLFRSKAAAQGITLRFVTDETTPQSLFTDPQRLRQILLNLLGNAVKFTERGEVRLRVTGDRDAASILFHVEDTGIGIAASALPTLFDPFVQADSSTTRRFEGTGLGLAIVQRFAALLGGSIRVESEVGRGSSFCVTLPVGEIPSIEMQAGSNVEEIPKLHPQLVRVLLVEDNPVNQMVGQRLLVRLGCTVEIAEDGRAAVQKVFHPGSSYDLVLMDCQMPILDGYQATREIRAKGGEFAQLPIVALTACALAEDRQRCLDAGMNDFLSKPLSANSLQNMIARWCQTVNT